MLVPAAAAWHALPCVVPSHPHRFVMHNGCRRVQLLYILSCSPPSLLLKLRLLHVYPTSVGNTFTPCISRIPCVSLVCLFNTQGWHMTVSCVSCSLRTYTVSRLSVSNERYLQPSLPLPFPTDRTAFNHSLSSAACHLPISVLALCSIFTRRCGVHEGGTDCTRVTNCMSQASSSVACPQRGKTKNCLLPGMT